MMIACTFGRPLSPAFSCKHMPVMRKYLRKMPKCWSHTPAVGKCLRDPPKWGSHTPAVVKCLWHVLKHSPGWLHLLLRTVNHTLWPLVTLKFLRNSQNAHFSPFALNSLSPWWPNSKPTMTSLAAWPKLTSLRVSFKYSII